MSETKEQVGLVQLRNVRLSFEHIFKKSASVKDGPLKYRANFIIDPKTPEGKKNLKQAEAAIQQVKEEMWGKNADKIRFKPDRYALKDGEMMVDKSGDVRDGYEGMKYVSATNERRPKVRDRDGRTELTEDDDKIYSGAYVNAFIRFYGIKNQDKGGNAIFASLEGVQFLRHGERFGNAGLDDDAFEDLGDEDDDRPRGKGRGIDDEDDNRPAQRQSRRMADEEI